MGRVQTVTCDRCGRRGELKPPFSQASAAFRHIEVAPVDGLFPTLASKERDLCGRCAGELEEFFDISQATERGLAPEGG